MSRLLTFRRPLFSGCDVPFFTFVSFRCGSPSSLGLSSQLVRAMDSSGFHFSSNHGSVPPFPASALANDPWSTRSWSQTNPDHLLSGCWTCPPEPFFNSSQSNTASTSGSPCSESRRVSRITAGGDCHDFSSSSSPEHHSFGSKTASLVPEAPGVALRCGRRTTR
jgi:hypothetical protein